MPRGERAESPVAAAARARLEAAERKKEEEAMRVSIDNMMRQKDLSEVKAKTDDDIMDEEAGRARIRLAEASALRREEEENALKIAEANRREKLKETKVKTDDDIMDEAAGKARLELAAKSAARRAESAEALRQQNKALAEKLRLAKAATDTSIDDEAAGTMRREYAEAARARRREEEERIKEENEEMRRRLRDMRARTDDGDGLTGGGTYGTSSMASTPGFIARQSDVPLSTFRMFEVTEDKAKVGEAIRKDRLKQKREVERQVKDHVSHGQKQALERIQREERVAKLQVTMAKRNQKIARAIRNQEARWELERERRQETYEKAMRERVVEANNLDARLDASEEAQDARERAEGTATKVALLAALERVRTRDLEVRKQLSARVRDETVQALQVATAIPAAMARALGEVKRQDALGWSSRRQQQEDEYLARARANKASVEATRANARAEKATVLAKRKEAANRERANDFLVAEEKARILEANRKEVAAVYSKRYVSKPEAKKWESSTLYKLHELLSFSKQKEERLLLRGPPHHASPRSPGSSPDRPVVKI